MATPVIPPDGAEGIKSRGHREYIGGHWELIGDLQKRFLINQGLKKKHKILDIGCGSLRLGVKLIPLLNKGCYFGVDKEPLLIEAGIEKEISKKLIQLKKPKFLVSDNFNFNEIIQRVDFAIAQSLFTHLPENLINLCFKNLHKVLMKNGKFFATFHLVKNELNNPVMPHSFGFFGYTKTEIKKFGENNLFKANIVGDWGHPRQQIMVKYTKN